MGCGGNEQFREQLLETLDTVIQYMEASVDAAISELRGGNVYQTAEKAFLAWKLAVKTLVALELLVSEDPLEAAKRINARVRDAVTLHRETGEPVLRVTTGSAPRLLRALGKEGEPPDPAFSWQASGGEARRLRASYRLLRGKHLPCGLPGRGGV